MYYLNKIVGALTNPVTVAAIGFFCALACAAQDKWRTAANRRSGWGVLVARRLLVGVGVWLWVWSTPALSRVLGVGLEREWLVSGKAPNIEALPSADVIELHGGSMGSATNIAARGEMWTNADRIWMAVRLWKAGKAPIIYVTGGGVKDSTAGLLEDFGVPTNAVVFAEEPRNTEEEVRYIGREVKGMAGKPKALVVTSAWHLTRTMLLYRKYAREIEAIPVPCDFENTLGAGRGLDLGDFWPNAQSLVWNSVCLHEWVGILGYQWFRR